MLKELDRIDREILTFLIQDARTTHTEIAKKLNVSPGTIHGRLKKLEKRKLIKGATIVINYEVVGYRFTAYVGLVLIRSSDTERIIESLRKIPEVTVADIATGQFSIFCKIRCRDNMHGKDVIYKINDISGVVRTETMISLEEPINDKERLFRSIFNI